ncbi:MAG: glutamine synthetase family protein [Pseudomonadota bacterium]
MDRKDIAKAIKDHGLRTIQFWLIDLFGRPRVTHVPASGLDRVLDNGAPLDGSSVAGMSRVDRSDLAAMPDLDSFRIVQGGAGIPAAAILFCDVHRPDGSGQALDSRSFLRRTVETSRGMGFTRFDILTELEYYYFKDRTAPNPTDQGGYFEAPRADPSTRALQETAELLEDVGMGIRVFHHENGPGQHEIEFRLEDALRQCDNLLLSKVLVDTVAQKHGMHASFMPKPMSDLIGSGLHVHQILWRGDENAFYDYGRTTRNLISETGMQYIAGLLDHAQEITLFTNQTVNSYKRLVPGHEAPAFLTWGIQNRLALIRVPAFAPDQPHRCRFEYRAADPMANPYLLVGLQLASGLDGIERGLVAPPEFKENTDLLTPVEREAKGYRCLPDDMDSAILAVEESSFLREVLGQELVAKYVGIKKEEWASFRQHVTDWEIKQYL